VGGQAKTAAERSLAGESLLYCAYRQLRASKTSIARRILDDELMSTAPKDQVELFRYTLDLLVGNRTSGTVLSPGLSTVGNTIAWLSSPRQKDSANILKTLGVAQDDPWCQEIPALTEVINGLRMAAEAVDRPEAIRARASSWPPWLQWMLLRLQLLSPDASRYAIDTTVACPKAPAFAWMLDQWYMLYGWPMAEFDELRTMRSVWQGTAAESDATIHYLNRLRNMATGLKSEDNKGSSLPHPLQWGVGERIGDLITQELRFEEYFGKARLLLRQGDLQNASSWFLTLLKDLGSAPRLCRLWWEPATRYWLGVTYAHRGLLDRARNELESTSKTVKGSDACGQLALLALSHGKLEDAERWICDARTVTPSVRYASALLQSRRGEFERAVALLQSFDQQFIEPATPYTLAFRRLRAVLQERNGNRAQAAQAYRVILNATPGDGVTIARSLRCRLTEALKNESRTDDLLTMPSVSPSDMSKLDFPLPSWFKEYQRLEHTLMCSPEEMSNGRNDMVKTAMRGGLQSPWISLLLWRLTRLNEAERIPNLLKRTLAASTGGRQLSAATGDEFDPARLNLLTKQLKKAESEAEQNTGLLAAYVYLLWEMFRKKWRVLASGTTKVVSKRRVALHHFAVVLSDSLRRHSSENLPAETSVWIKLADAFASAMVSDTGADFAGTEAQDEDATLDCLFRSSTAPFATDAIPVLLRSFRQDARLPAEVACLHDALAQLEQQDSEGFSKSYASLTTDLCALPVPAPDLWLAWAQCRLLAGDIDAVLANELPDCLADLSQVGVRSLIGIAYARAAMASQALGDNRKALTQSRQALSTLALNREEA
jgi:tetratricopeptide (TPR) repeat protein